MNNKLIVLKLLKCILSITVFSFATSQARAQTIKVNDLNTVGGTQFVTNFPSFDSFNFVVGELENGAEIVLWETTPVNYNCHFYSLEPFFDFKGKKYWIDSGEGSSLNQGIDPFEIFLDNYFTRFAFKNLTAEKYYLNKDLSKKSTDELDLQKDDIFVFIDTAGVNVHSGRFVKFEGDEPLITSKIGGAPVEDMTLSELIKTYDYLNLYQIRLYRAN